MPSSRRHGVAFPLNVLYQRAGLAAPSVRAVTNAGLPAPYRDLLVHERDMTSTLERHFGDRIEVRVLNTFNSDGLYFRRVLLALAGSGRPVCMGAVAIRLNALPDRVQSRIVGQRAPLGRVLSAARIDFVSRPEAFFRVTPNGEMLGVFHMPAAVPLYGRQDRLRVQGTIIGTIVEVLPRL